MKSAKLVLAFAVAAMGFSSLSFAEGSYIRDYQAPRTEYRVGPSVQDQRGYDNRAYDNRRVDNRGYDNRGYDSRSYDNRSYDNRAGRYDPRATQYRRGGYVPTEYRGRQYQVNDWRARHLAAPQQGQQWVQVGTNYALIAIATGLIANLVLN